MAKNVFRPAEIVALTKQVMLDSPFKKVPEPEMIIPAEEYTGPTADDLRREAEAFRINWEAEKEMMISQARAEADRIINEAEQSAFDQVKQKNDEALQIKQKAEDEAGDLLDNAEKQVRSMMDDAEKQVSGLHEASRKEGYTEGREEGFAEGRAEVDRLIEHLHTIISNAIEKRNQIIDQSETQIIDLVLLISQKIIKVISENQKNVVINNVIQALRKLKSRGDVVIRVNLDDVKLTSEHVKDFMRMVENVRSITVMEDSSVDRGGCIIETDFGRIDARISSQFKEIEEKILELVPIRASGEE
ncbi:MAG: flagellar assembly protein FliH [Spirochaetales bacterium]|nr:flagellar assembly protein FliH [Spirochaetales bacterium]